MAEDVENCSNSAMGGTWVKRGGGGNRRSWPPLSHLLEAGVREERRVAMAGYGQRPCFIPGTEWILSQLIRKLKSLMIELQTNMHLRTSKPTIIERVTL